MGKASRTKQDGDRRARIAAQRDAQRRAEQRRRIYLAGGSILVVAIVAIALVLVKLNGGTPAAASNGPTGAALSTVTKQVEDIPTSVTDKVGSGGVNTGLFTTTQTSTQISNAATQLGSYFGTTNSSAPLTSGGKPEVLYLGGEYCPYCATQRWAMINALSRFGTFSGLTTTHSSSTDVDPNTPTFTFYKSTYTSKYVNFTPVEEYGATSSTVLQTPTAAQQALAQQYDPGSGTGSPIPFIDLGNKYVQVGNLAPLSPTLLAGKSWSQVSAAMANPSGSQLGTAEIGNANYMTAAICKLTNNQPATACTPTIQTLETSLAS
jgi:thiol-disulfide isomerase/thioredoxin